MQASRLRGAASRSQASVANLAGQSFGKSQAQI